MASKTAPVLPTTAQPKISSSFIMNRSRNVYRTKRQRELLERYAPKLSIDSKSFHAPIKADFKAHENLFGMEIKDSLVKPPKNDENAPITVPLDKSEHKKSKVDLDKFKDKENVEKIHKKEPPVKRRALRPRNTVTKATKTKKKTSPPPQSIPSSPIENTISKAPTPPPSPDQLFEKPKMPLSEMIATFQPGWKPRVLGITEGALKPGTRTLKSYRSGYIQPSHNIQREFDQFFFV